MATPSTAHEGLQPRATPAAPRQLLPLVSQHIHRVY
jgi:hypothetical protein